VITLKSLSFSNLEERLNYKFKNTEFIIEALTHSSYQNEIKNEQCSHNERFEFLGDAVLNLLVTKKIMELSPKLSEGKLSKLRSKIISETSLVDAARRLKLGDYLLIGKGEEKSGGRNRTSLLADTLEAVLAAVFLDSGLEKAEEVLLGIFSDLFETADWKKKVHELLRKDYKSNLQEMCQSLSLTAPVYECVDVLGPEHDRNFKMSLKVNGVELKTALSKTKKEATQIAAQEFFEENNLTKKRIKEIFMEKGIMRKTQN